MNNREWLYGMEPSELAAWFDAEHVESNDGIGPESVVRADSMDANDSREKLEADVRYRSIRPTTKIDCHYDDVLRWLDRQAAITANETNYNNPYVGLVRGKQWERTEISDYYCGRCGWRVTDHDSYCPECGGALHKAPNKPDGKSNAPKTAESGEIRASKDDIRDFDDSREKLEADCTAAWKSVERIVRSGGMPKERWTNSEFFKLLDRQAAITKAKCEESLASKNLGRLYEPRDNDTREALENDAVLYCDHFTCTHQRFNEAKLIALLDRQAAITERECREYEDALREQHHNRISELKRERDDLKAQVDEILAGDKATDAINAELAAKVKDLENQVEVWMDAAGNAHDMWEKADSRRVEVERECDSLVIDLADCERLVADLRDKLSRACDNAHDTLRMMDEGLA